MTDVKPAAFGKANYLVLLLLYLLSGLALSHQVQAQSFPPGFTRVQVASGLTNPTSMAFAPDGRIFVTQQNGTLRIIKNGNLLATPFLRLNVNSAGEQGLLGIALDPNFSSNQYVYLYYSLPDGTRNRISRFKGNGDVVVAGSELVLLNLDPVRGNYHNGGTMQFGLDGKLYVAIGENSNPAHAQNLDTYHGKLLRINPDGSVPTGNPFTGSAQRSRIWAYGLRNPFTFDIQPGTGKIFVNDVGAKAWEEINDATTRGKNFGWPTVEGNSSNVAFANPVYAYPYEPGSSDGVGCAITGGTFFNPATTNYPSQYYGRYFYQDYCNGWINMLSISGSTVTRMPFATGLGGNAINIKTGTDGNLYFFERSTSALYRIIYTNNTVPAIARHPVNITVPAGQSASFSVTATGTAPLRYQWQRNGINISNATGATFTIASATSSHAGAYRVVVSNAAGSVTSNTAQLTVTALNNPPVAQIQTPLANTLYRGGDTIRFSGSATDPEDGTLSASAFTWLVDFHHDTHKHDSPPIATGVRSGYYVIPRTGEVSDNVWYRFILVVKDSKGLTSTTYRDVFPRKTTMSLATQPAGLQVTLDGQPVRTSTSVVGVEGIRRSIGIVNGQVLNGKTYDFARWQHGGSATQTITTPINDITYTAVYQERIFNPLRLEAENAARSGAVVTTSHSGYTGSGYADYVNASGDYVEWTVRVPHTGSYTISFRYALASTPRSLRISANGTTLNAGLSFARTSTWSSWSNVAITANLNAGTNRIRATATGSSGPNIDHIVVSWNSQLASLANAQPVGIDGPANVFTVSPNPARQIVNLDVMANEGEAIRVNLVNMQGKVLSTHQLKGTSTGMNSFTLNLQNLSSGPYILQLVKESATVSKLIIIEK